MMAVTLIAYVVIMFTAVFRIYKLMKNYCDWSL